MTEIEAPPHALYRLHLKTAGDRAKVIDYCLRENVIGLGWGMNWSEGGHPVPRVFEEWREYAEQIWPRRRMWEFWPVIWMHDASEGDVPGAVVRSYSHRGRAFLHVSDVGAAWYSAYLFAEKAGMALPDR